MNKIYKWLKWVTNNDNEMSEAEWKHNEVNFDIAFFIINTFCLVFGTLLLIYWKEYPWIAVLVIEYTWSLDNMRHNR